MRIAFDISPIQYTGTGVARYTRNLIENLVILDRNNTYTLFFNSFGNKLDREFALTMEQWSNVVIKQFYVPEKLLHFIWNELNLFPIELLIGKQDIFYYSDWFTPPFSGEKITTVHDMVFKRYPETVHRYIRDSQEKRLAFLQRSKATIIADSYTTEEDIHKEYPKLNNNISVIFPGVHTEKQTELFCSKTVHKYSLFKPYILAVGKNEPRKNLNKLIEAFTALNNNSVDLVIVGPNGWGDQTMPPNIHNIGLIEDKELFALYQNALFFILPSLYEGFGFPLIEAMSLGCPTTCSNTSSLSEIAGGASMFFNPLQIDEMVAIMKRLTTDSVLRHTLSEKGLEQAKHFQWKDTARTILEILQNLE